jgi:hypothetical protein
MEHQIAPNQAGVICETIWPLIVPRLKQQLWAMNCTRREHKHLGSNLDLFVSLDTHRASHSVPGTLEFFHITASQNGWLSASFTQNRTNIGAATPITQLTKAFIAAGKVPNTDVEPIGMHSAALEKSHKF